MYSTFERMKDLGWSIGICDLKTTPAGYVYLDLENEEEFKCILDDLKAMRQISSTTILVDKIGGVRLTSDYCENGIINGLIEGVSYDLEVYNGTDYFYYDATVNARYFQSYEMYLLDKYVPLQDYLFEIEIPEWLPEGYYDIDAVGLFRYVKGTQYSDATDFNKRLLYQYTAHEEGDWSLSENAIPYPYSENNDLNQFRAYDEGVFAWEQTRSRTLDEIREEEAEALEEAKSDLGLANFLAASKTTTELWLPAGKDYTISVESSETTGSIFLHSSGGGSIKMPYDRIAGTYTCSGSGTGEKVTLEVKGLYSDYTIRLYNAESYHGQDTVVDAPEETAAE